MSVRVDFKGKEVAKRVHEAEERGLKMTGAQMVERARSSHPGWKSQTGEAERSIQAEPVERTATGARLRFGSSLARFIWLEIGSRGRAGDSTLRRAADVEGGHLGERVRSELR